MGAINKSIRKRKGAGGIKFRSVVIGCWLLRASSGGIAERSSELLLDLQLKSLLFVMALHAQNADGLLFFKNLIHRK